MPFEFPGHAEGPLIYDQTELKRQAAVPSEEKPSDGKQWDCEAAKARLAERIAFRRGFIDSISQYLPEPDDDLCHVFGLLKEREAEIERLTVNLERQIETEELFVRVERKGLQTENQRLRGELERLKAKLKEAENWEDRNGD